MRNIFIALGTLFFCSGLRAQAVDQGIREKIYVHVDKPDYLSGEVLWFKIYCVDAISHKPLDLSKVCYVDILDRNDHFVLQAKIGMKDAEGRGSFYLPLNLPSGIYKLRAYTSWMKNFGPGDFFEQPVTIINTLKELPEPPVSNADSVLPARSLDTLVFCPEGGNLVTGIPSVIAFRTTDGEGRGLDCRGAITDERSDTVAVFQSERYGIGRFAFTPGEGQHYKAHIVFADRTSSLQDLPSAYAQGYVMRVDDASQDRIRVAVYAHGVASPGIYLVAGTGSANRHIYQNQLSGDSAEFLIPRDSLGDGITRLTLLSALQKPFCERLVFKRPAGHLPIALGSDKEQYDTRGKVSLTLSLPGEQDDPKQGEGKASLSLSVYRLDSLDFPHGMDMSAYLWLGSDLKGRIDDPAYYLTATGPEAGRAIDNLMLTHGWRRFRWDDQKTDSHPFTFPPEYSGHIISGRLTDMHTGLPLVGRMATLSVPGIDYRFRVAATDSSGRMIFDIKDFYGQQGIVIHTGTIVDSPCKVDILSPFSEQFGGDRLPVFSLEPTEKETLMARHLDMQVQNIYTADSIQRLRAPDVDALHFFNIPDHTYMLDDYTRFTTMEEVLREYVREINVNRPHGKLHVLMLDEPDKMFFDDNNTLVLLDGVQVPDDKIFDYDPLKVRRLDVVSRRYFIGPTFYSGVASFSTYKGDYAGFELDRHSTLLDYDCLQWQREFYAPQYATAAQHAARLPDFRNLLYWSPDIHLQGKEKKQVDFYASDLPGTYLVIVQGLEADGRAGYQQVQFEVR